MLEASPITFSLKGYVPERAGNSDPSAAPYDTFKAKDGYVTIGISTERQWGKFCDALGMGHLKEDERFITNELRVKNYDTALKDAIEDVTSQMSKFDIEEKLREVRLACGAVYTVTEAMESEQIKERKMLVEVDDKALGKIRIPGTVIKMDQTPGGFTQGAPLLGEHTELYLKKLGYTDAQIVELKEKNIVEMA